MAQFEKWIQRKLNFFNGFKQQRSFVAVTGSIQFTPIALQTLLSFHRPPGRSSRHLVVPTTILVTLAVIRGQAVHVAKGRTVLTGEGRGRHVVQRCWLWLVVVLGTPWDGPLGPLTTHHACCRISIRRRVHSNSSSWVQHQLAGLQPVANRRAPSGLCRISPRLGRRPAQSNFRVTTDLRRRPSEPGFRVPTDLRGRPLQSNLLPPGLGGCPTELNLRWFPVEEAAPADNAGSRRSQRAA